MPELILKYRQAGFTLVELIISLVIISIALMGIFTVINLTTVSSANPVVQFQALAIAESYMEEILLQAYCDPATACVLNGTLGAETGETRDTYNDVDDYNNLPDNLVRDRQNNTITSLAAYTVSVTVIENPNAAGLPAKLITVTVTGSGIAAIVLTGYAFLAG